MISDAESIKRRKSYLISEPLSTNEREAVPYHMKKMCDGLPVVWTEAIIENLQEDVELMTEVTTYINYTSENINNS